MSTEDYPELRKYTDDPKLIEKLSILYNHELISSEWLNKFIFELNIFGYDITKWLQIFVIEGTVAIRFGCRLHSNLFKEGTNITIPLSFFELENISWLTIDTSHIKSLMRYRGVKTHLTELPEEMNNMRNLKKLTISSPVLETLGKLKLEKLEELNVVAPLKTLPDLSIFPKLRKISILRI